MTQYIVSYATLSNSFRVLTTEAKIFDWLAHDKVVITEIHERINQFGEASNIGWFESGKLIEELRAKAIFARLKKEDSLKPIKPLGGDTDHSPYRCKLNEAISAINKLIKKEKKNDR